MSHYHWHANNRRNTLNIYCYIQANTAHSGFAGLFDQRLKIKVSAAATEGAANKGLIKFLAVQFGVPKSRIQLTKGQSSRYKTIIIDSPEKIPEQAQIIRPEFMSTAR